MMTRFFHRPIRKVVVVEHLPHFYSPEALEITVNGKPVEVLTMWQRYRDGGTSIVPTTAGKLYRPSPYNKTARATLAGKEIDLDWQVQYHEEKN